MDEKVAFYREWLPLPKNDFRILAMLADKGGSFKGSLADMCRCLNVGSGQSKTNSRIRASIESLTADGFITHQKQGNTYTLSLVPKETKIEVFRRVGVGLRIRFLTANIILACGSLKNIRNLRVRCEQQGSISMVVCLGREKPRYFLPDEYTLGKKY